MDEYDEIEFTLSGFLPFAEYVNVEKLKELRKLGERPSVEDLTNGILDCFKTPFLLHLLDDAIEMGNTPVIRLLTREVNYRMMQMMHEKKNHKPD